MKDIGLNPAEHRKKAKIVFKEDTANMLKWRKRHLAKFDPNFLKVTELKLEKKESYTPHMFVSEEHVMQCSDIETKQEKFRFNQEVQAQNFVLTGYTSEQIDSLLKDKGFEMI